MWWKVYFWVMLVLTIFGTILVFQKYSPLKIIDLFNLAIGGAIVFSIYSVAYSKKIWPAKNWKVLFWIAIAWYALDFLLGLNLLDSSQFEFLQGRITPSNNLIAQIIDLIFIAPALWATYKLGYKK